MTAALTRIEQLLDAIAGAGPAPKYPDWPLTRDEEYLYAILEGSDDVPPPLTEKQQYLYRRATGSGEIPDYPKTGELAYWAFFAGEEIELPPKLVSLWEHIEGASAPPEPSASYSYIDPIDPVAFPVRSGLKLIVLDGAEEWKYSGSACYTSDFADIIKSQDRATVLGYCADYDFEPAVQGIASMSDNSFIFNGTSSVPVNGNLSFKNEHTLSVADWKAYLAGHPLTVLISTKNPDASVWKPAVKDNVTGYWNGSDGFAGVHGGIPYYGDNLLTEELIKNFFPAWINTSYEWRSAGDSASVKVPVEAGKYYRLSWDFGAETGTAFRYGFCNIADEPPATLSAPRARTSPTYAPTVDILASATGLVIQASRVTTADPESIRFRQLSVREMVGYEPPVMLMGMRPPMPDPEPDPEEDPEEEPEEGGDELICPVCGKTYTSESWYNKHLLTHEEEENNG